MPLVSPTQVVPGTTVRASDVNTPVNQIASLVNGNLDGYNIANGAISAAKMDTNANVETRMSETLSNSIPSGCVWSTVSGLNGAMTAGVAYVLGKRLGVALISSRAFTASKDTYIYIDSSGVVQYLVVANNAAQPALPANSVWDYKVVTSASAITSVTDIRGKAVAANNIDLATLLSAQQTWQTPAYVTGWSDFDNGVGAGTYGGVRYMKDSLGIVHLKGLVKNTSGSTKPSNSTLFTLPTGYRPAATAIISTIYNDVFCRVDIFANGDVQPAVSLANNQWISLNNISYKADG